MLKRFKLKRATQFTLFATAFMVGSIIAIYIFLVADLNNYLMELGILENASLFLGGQHFLILATAGAIAFTVSSIIIENMLNPMRQMISKVQEIGDMNFGSPLVIDENDDELREYAFALNTMAAKLNRYIEMQKRFVSDASHELATPITVINGHADLLLRHGFNESSISTIKQEILRMSGLVDSLLLLARSDSGGQSYKFEPTDINALITESMEEFRLTAPDFIFEAKLEPKIQARCDEYAIRRVIRILLSNAIKYSADSAERQGCIKITAQTSHGILNISVKDNGIGIPQKHLTRIFERFYRVDASRSRKTGSSGLGLAIAREIITAHGGEIKASSSGEGTEVSFGLSV